MLSCQLNLNSYLDIEEYEMGKIVTEQICPAEGVSSKVGQTQIKGHPPYLIRSFKLRFKISSVTNPVDRKGMRPLNCYLSIKLTFCQLLIVSMEVAS